MPSLLMHTTYSPLCFHPPSRSDPGRALQCATRAPPSPPLPPQTFRFAYTDPRKDVDVSGSMEYTGTVEPLISKVRGAARCSLLPLMCLDHAQYKGGRQVLTVNIFL